VNAIEPDVSKWDAWPPERVARLLEGVRAPWYVAAGWAIDLFLGEERREQQKNQADLDATLQRLEPERRRWLRDALELVHPAHPWLAELEESAA
jgi:hypothetical protein